MTSMTNPCRFLCLALALTGALSLVATTGSAETELVHEFSVIPGQDGQPNFGFPFLAETTPDGGHLYVVTFPPFASLLTFERVGQSLELRDSLDLLDAGMDLFSDIELSEDGAFLFAGEGVSGTLRIFARDADSGQLGLAQTFEEVLGSSTAVVDGVEVGTETAVVWGRPGFPETGGVFVELSRSGAGTWGITNNSVEVQDPSVGIGRRDEGEQVGWLTQRATTGDRILDVAIASDPDPSAQLPGARVSLFSDPDSPSLFSTGISLSQSGTLMAPCRRTFVELGVSLKDPYKIYLSIQSAPAPDFAILHQIEIVSRDGKAVSFVLEAPRCTLISSSVVEFRLFDAETDPVDSITLQQAVAGQLARILFPVLDRDQGLGAVGISTAADGGAPP
ncbi:MAG TPA: hypothetical protein VNB06_15700 [Thermoanaerobaculia bacterium]|nr:hypothetical protein [Thermoanaerobaculia bacterium]